MHIPKSISVPSRAAVSSDVHFAILPRFVYHPAMLDGAKLGVKAIILIVIFVFLLVLSLGFLCWCCVRRKRRSRRKRKTLEREQREWKDLFLQKGADGDSVQSGLTQGKGKREEVDEWEVLGRRERYHRYKEARDRARREEKEGRGKYVMGGERVEMVFMDGFGRKVDGFGKPVQVPKRARARDWKMWNLPHSDGH